MVSQQLEYINYALLIVKINGLPPTVNHIYNQNRRGRRFKSYECVQWQQEAIKNILQSKNKKISYPFVEPVKLNVIFVSTNNRRWDLDNRMKALQDCLELSEIIKDDSQIRELHIRRVRSYHEQTILSLTKLRNELHGKNII